uniref:Uncharacterized protein n=1 Tax=Rhizophora mucronata TaxID=61149 RepID=A0A2P2JDR3_RHIMU
MSLILAAKICPFITCKTTTKASKPDFDYKLQSRYVTAKSYNDAPPDRRHVLVCSASFVTLLSLNCIFAPLRVRAEDRSNGQEAKDAGVIGAIKSLFDPDEKN